MKPSSAIVLKGLLEKCPEEKRKVLEKFLSTKEEDMVKELPALTKEIFSEKFFHDGLIDSVHYSWFIPVLKIYEEKAYILLALNTRSRTSLAKILKIPLSKQKLTNVSKRFFQKILQESLIGNDKNLLPVDYLPESPLNVLLSLSKKELIQLIDYLSLYDLIAEIRQIVETKTLNNIYNFLSKNKKKFLKSKMSYKEPFSFYRIGLDKWDGNKEVLLHMLHKRGLQRLAIAMSFVHRDLTWYIAHQLDIGRGTTLYKLSEKKANPKIVKTITDHILEIIDLIKT